MMMCGKNGDPRALPKLVRLELCLTVSRICFLPISNIVAVAKVKSHTY